MGILSSPRGARAVLRRGLALCLLLAGCPEAPSSPEQAVDQAVGGDLAPPDAATPDQTSCESSYPAGPYGVQVGATLDGALAFKDQSGQPLSVAAQHTPCAASAQLLVLRLSTGFCGTCKQAVLTGDELSAALPGKVTLWELLATDELNQPVDDAALTRFAATLPKGAAAARHATLSHGLLAALGVTPAGGEPLPLVLIIDRRTMKVRARLAAPDPDWLRDAALAARATSDGDAPPNPTTPVLTDGRFTRDRWAMVQAMALPAGLKPSPDPTNRFADNAAAAALGREVFLDSRIGGVGMMSCTNCHDPARFYQDGRVTALGLDPQAVLAFGDRNSPWLGSAAFQRWQFWDGRADSQWMQALGPLENDVEYSSSRLAIVRAVLGFYGPAYAALFGAAPDLSDMQRFPPKGRPGMAAWDAMAADDKLTVNRAFSNLGKALAAFERTIIPLPMPLDRYAGGDMAALTDTQKDGLKAFFDLGCATCHYGPFLTDGSFHAMGVGTGRRDQQADPGRRAGLAQLLGNEFNGAGAFSDDRVAGAAALALLRDDPVLEGQFKTPSLRGVANSAPYGHGGTHFELTAFLRLLGSGGEPAGGKATMPQRDPAMVYFDPMDPRLASVVAFLQTMRGTVPPF